MKSLSAKTFQCGVTVQGLTTLSGTVYLTALTNTATWDYIIVGTSAQGQLYTRTYAQLMSDVSSGITLSLDGLSDVVAPTPSTGQLLRYNGIQWANWTPNFLSAEADTLDSVTTRGNTTTNAITVGGLTSNGNVNVGSNFVGNGTMQYVHFTGGSGEFRFKNGSGGGWYYTWCQNSGDGLAERRRLSSGNNLLIGTTTDSGYGLDVNGKTRLTGTSLVYIKLAKENIYLRVD